MTVLQPKNLGGHSHLRQPVAEPRVESMGWRGFRNFSKGIKWWICGTSYT